MIEPIISLPKDVLTSMSTEVRVLLSTEKYKHAKNVIQQADMIEAAMVYAIKQYAPSYEPLVYEDD